MDPATIIGILLAFGALVTMVLLEGAQITSILLPAPIILVFGASIDRKSTRLNSSHWE